MIANSCRRLTNRKMNCALLNSFLLNIEILFSANWINHSRDRGSGFIEKNLDHASVRCYHPVPLNQHGLLFIIWDLVVQVYDKEAWKTHQTSFPTSTVQSGLATKWSSGPNSHTSTWKQGQATQRCMETQELRYRKMAAGALDWWVKIWKIWLEQKGVCWPKGWREVHLSGSAGNREAWCRYLARLGLRFCKWSWRFGQD